MVVRDARDSFLMTSRIPVQVQDKVEDEGQEEQDDGEGPNLA